MSNFIDDCETYDNEPSSNNCIRQEDTSGTKTTPIHGIVLTKTFIQVVFSLVYGVVNCCRKWEIIAVHRV